MVQIFFDGQCIVCSLEILHYKKIAPQLFSIIDISAPEFNAQKYNLDNKLVNKYIHVCVDGKVYTKIDAFVQIWKVLPDNQKWFKLLLKMSSIKFIRFFMDIVYVIFAHLRPFLPKK